MTDVIPTPPDMFANPYLLCPVCQQRVTNVDWSTRPAVSIPCGHTKDYVAVCFSWSPVDGCTCKEHGLWPHRAARDGGA